MRSKLEQTAKVLEEMSKKGLDKDSEYCDKNIEFFQRTSKIKQKIEDYKNCALELKLDLDSESMAKTIAKALGVKLNVDKELVIHNHVNLDHSAKERKKMIARQQEIRE